MGISVVICCYNSEKRIKPTLEHLLNQKKISAEEWEVLIIDNASVDNTAKFAHEIWNCIESSSKPIFKIFNELQPGLSFARLRGIKESTYDYVLFCDDDNWLDEHYIKNAIEIVTSNPKIGVLGGLGIPFIGDRELPFFLKEQCLGLAVGEQYSIEGDITNTRKVVYGAGMVLKKEVFQELVNSYDFHFQTTDRIGNSLISSGDYEICLAIRLIGYEVHWYKKLTFYHEIPPSRLELKYLKRLFIGIGMSQPFLIGYGLNKSNCKGIKADYRYIFLRLLKNTVLSFSKLVISGYFFSSNWEFYFDKLYDFYSTKGYLYSTLKNKNIIKNNFLNTKLFITMNK